MAVEPIAAQHAERQVSLARRAASELGQLWRLIDPANIAASWGGLLPQALAILGTSQATAAASAGIYVDDALEAQGVTAEAAGRVNPGAFAGIASDGRPLASLLLEPPITALTQIKQGASPAQALNSGRFLLDLITRTQVADAGRTAVGTAIAARPDVGGYVRVVVGKTCARCLILAGRRYRWNAGFRRHFRCDCRHVPISGPVPDDVRVNPRAYFDALSRSEQDEAFGKAGAKAIREGADMARVVNARRGMYTAGGQQLTTEATTRRGIGRRVRLMPEEIYRIAGDDRAGAVHLLRAHGYLTGPVPRVADVAPRPVRLPVAPTPAVPAPVRPRVFTDRVAAAAVGERALDSAPLSLSRKETHAVPGGRDGLTSLQRKALQDYQGSAYQDVNGRLRDLAAGRPGVAPDPATEATIRKLDEAMAASKLTQDVIVYRGIREGRLVFGDRVGGNLTGMEWREGAFVSTSAAEGVVSDFTEGRGTREPVRMRILAPRGTGAVQISGMTQGATGVVVDEAELLLARGARMRVVTDRGETDGVRLLDVEVVPGD